MSWLSCMISLIYFIFVGKYSIYCSKIDAKIYQSIYNYSACVLLTNATHQIGCTSHIKGNNGILHLVNDDSDVDWIINTGPHAPYIPLLNTSMFNKEVMSRLMESKKISGALVIHSRYTRNPPEGFSPDTECPMDNFGMYTSNDEYKNCKKRRWNPFGNGMSFTYYGIPIFLLQNDSEIAAIVECYKMYNKPSKESRRSYPLCAVEMKDFMFAAKDTPTCRRKTEMTNPIQNTYCDPLGDSNIFSTLYPLTGKLKKSDVIMVTTKMDSAGFFHDYLPSVDNGVTGIVALLAAAYALGEYKRNVKDANETESLKPISFAMLNGESWDYIGSSKMIYDMMQGNFPYEGSVDDNSASKIDLENIGYFIEISQVGLGNNIYLHTDPVSQKKSSVKDKVDNMRKALMDSAKEAGTKLFNVNESLNQPLPPASLQMFLRERMDIPGVVLTDHEKAFTNKYYNSRFDNAENLGITLQTRNNSFIEIHTPLSMKLANLSETIANAVYLLASGGKPPRDKIEVPSNLTANLLYCLIYSASCPSFKEILGRKSKSFPNSAYSRYISVLQMDNTITKIFKRLLSYYTGDWLPEKNCSGRVSLKLPNAHNYVVLRGNGKDFICVRSSTYLTPAVSPAFELMDYTSRKYSTWAESMWYSDIGIQIYLKADPTIEGVTLAAGISIFFLSFGFVYVVNKKATLLFDPTTPQLVING